MSGGDSPGQPDWPSTLAGIDSLISGKKRSDGRNWAHAFGMMDLYLEVGAHNAHLHSFLWGAQAQPQSVRAQRAELKGRLGELSVIHVAGTKGKVRARGKLCAAARVLPRRW